jgi:NADH:ubiquinone oxidoreductase subunit 3 (subunit A)
MWLIVFIVALLFVAGHALLLLRSANADKIPDNVKPQPYESDEGSGW